MSVSRVAEIVIPASAGSTNPDVILSGFIGSKIRVDPSFRNFLTSKGASYNHGKEILCDVLRAQRSARMNGEIRNTARELEPSIACAILAHLSNEGRSLLDIAEGEEEVNLVIGCTEKQGVIFILYVEHENERGVDEIHLHAKPITKLGDDTMMVLSFK